MLVALAVVAPTDRGLRHERRRCDERAVAAAEHAAMLLEAAVVQAPDEPGLGVGSIAFDPGQSAGVPRAPPASLRRQAFARVPALHGVARAAGMRDPVRRPIVPAAFERMLARRLPGVLPPPPARA